MNMATVNTFIHVLNTRMECSECHVNCLSWHFADEPIDSSGPVCVACWFIVNTDDETEG